MSDKLKVGIVGCGAIASIRHIPAFIRLKKNVILRAVCDKNESLAGAVASKYGIPGVYSDLSLMLTNEELDIVDICTPPQIHSLLALEAMENGCHVILEKPMALKTSDCDEMLEASRKNRVKLCVIHNQLFYPPVIEARQLIANGAIGDLIGLRMFMADPAEEMVLRRDYWVHKLPGGLIGETGPHAVYKSLPFIGKVKEIDIHAKCILKCPWAPFDDFRIDLEGEKGYSSIVISYASNKRLSTIDFLGRTGSLHLDLIGMSLIRYGGRNSMNPLSIAQNSLWTVSQILRHMVRNTSGVLAKSFKFGHSIVIEKFVDCIVNNTEPPMYPEEGRETTRVMEMIVQKLTENTPDQ